MDFSILLTDLRDVAEKYKGKTTEPQVSTLAYVDMFTKILRRAQKATDSYDDQITVLWVALNQLASIYKDLSSGTARDQLCRFIFGMCARTVLNIQWPQLEEDNKIKKNFCATVENVHEILSELGFEKFQIILSLMDSHWTHPILSQIMSGEDEDIEGGLEYIQKEDPDILKLRVEIMMKENCEEFALNLCEWSLKHPSLIDDLKIKENQIFILYKQGEYSKMQEVCETIVCHDGIKVMSHLAKTPSNQALCIRLAQVFLIQDWIKPERTCCTQELLKLWIHHQYLADKDEERFLDSIWTVAKVCRDTEQIGVLIDGVRKECGDMFIQLYTELCKYAINIDKGNMDLEQTNNNPEGVRHRKLAITKTCIRIAHMLKEYDFRISRICGLTAFALDPTTDNLNLVNKLYWTIKNTSATSENSKINPATIYEVERLLGLMRPELLNPEYSWKQLIPICKKYKIDYDKDNPDQKGAPGNLVTEQQPFVSTAAKIEPSVNMTNIGNKFKSKLTVQSDKRKVSAETNAKRSRPKKSKEPLDIQKAHLQKMLSQNKSLSRDQIEKILSEQFPRNAVKDLSEGPSLTMKELDKTIDDLKKSIYLETQYRQALEQNLSPIANSRKTSSSSTSQIESSSKKDAVPLHHVSRQEQFKNSQQQQQKPQNQQGSSSVLQRQHSSPAVTHSQGHGHGQDQTQSHKLQRQLSQGSYRPVMAHSHHSRDLTSPIGMYGGSPPPAHSNHSNRVTSPGLYSYTANQASISHETHSDGPAGNLGVGKLGIPGHGNCPKGQTQPGSQYSVKGQDHSGGQYAHTNTAKSPVQGRHQYVSPTGANSAASYSQKISSQLSSQIQNEIRKQSLSPPQNRHVSHPNILRPVGTSKQECAKIAQQIAEMHERQRAEKEKLIKMRLQGQIDGRKAALNSHNIPSSSQISTLLSMTLKGKGSATSLQQFQSQLQTNNKQVLHQSKSKSDKKFDKSGAFGSTQKPVSSVETTSKRPTVHGFQPKNVNPNANSAVPPTVETSKQNDKRKMKKQKYYLTTEKVMNQLRRDGNGNVNVGDSQVSIKPVFSMIVPKSMTSPGNQEELVKTVTDLVKKAQNSKAGNACQQKDAIGRNSAILPAPLTHEQQTPVRKLVTIAAETSNVTMPRQQSVHYVDNTLSDTTNLSSGFNAVSSTSIPFIQPLLQSTAQGDFITTDSMVLPATVDTIQLGRSQNVNIGGIMGSPDLQNTFVNASVSLLEQTVGQQLAGIQHSQTASVQPVHALFGSTLVPSQQVVSTHQQPLIQQQDSLAGTSAVFSTPQYSQSIVTTQQPFIGTQQILDVQPQLVVSPQSSIGFQQTAIPQVVSVQNIAIQNFAEPINTTHPVVNIASSHQTTSLQQGGLSLRNIPHVGLFNETVPQSMAFQQTHQQDLINLQNTGNLPTVVEPARNVNQSFVVAPELSPAVVQQILSNLKRTGAMAMAAKQTGEKMLLKRNNQSQSNSHLPINKHSQSVNQSRPTNQLQMKNTAMTNTSSNNQNKNLKESESVLEASQKILQLRKQFNQMHDNQSTGIGASATTASSQANKRMQPLLNSPIITGFKPKVIYSTEGLQPILPMASTAISNQTTSGMGSVPCSVQHKSVASSTVPTGLNNTVASAAVPRQMQRITSSEASFKASSSSGGLLQKLIETDADLATLTRQEKQLQLMSPTRSIDTVNSPLMTHSTLLNQSIPDLPDLGSKEFQIDSILSLDNEVTSTAVELPTKNNSDVSEVQVKVNETVPPHNQAVIANANISSEMIKANSDQVLLSKTEQFLTVKPDIVQHEDVKVKADVKVNSKMPDDRLQPSSQGMSVPQKSATNNEDSSGTSSQSTYLNANRIAKERESKIIEPVQKISPNQEADATSGKRSVIICQMCGVYFRTKQQLTHHMEGPACNRTKNQGEIAPCSICKKKFTSMVALKDHIKNACTTKNQSSAKDFEYSVTFKCTKCNFMNSNEKISRKHVEMCSRNIASSPIKAQLLTMYRCRMCSDMFSDRESTYRHVSKLCPQLEAVTTQKKVQDVYDKLKCSKIMHGTIVPTVQEFKNMSNKALIVDKNKLESKTDKDCQLHSNKDLDKAGYSNLVKTESNTNKYLSTESSTKLRIQQQEKIGEKRNVVQKSVFVDRELKGGTPKEVFKDSKEQKTKTMNPIADIKKNLVVTEKQKSVAADKSEKRRSVSKKNSTPKQENLHATLEQDVVSKELKGQNKTKNITDSTHSNKNNVDSKKVHSETLNIPISESLKASSMNCMAKVSTQNSKVTHNPNMQVNKSNIIVKDGNFKHVQSKVDEMADAAHIEACLKAQKERERSEKFYWEEFNALEKKKREIRARKHAEMMMKKQLKEAMRLKEEMMMNAAKVERNLEISNDVKETVKTEDIPNSNRGVKRENTEEKRKRNNSIDSVKKSIKVEEKKNDTKKSFKAEENKEHVKSKLVEESKKTIRQEKHDMKKSTNNLSKRKREKEEDTEDEIAEDVKKNNKANEEWEANDLLSGRDLTGSKINSTSPDARKKKGLREKRLIKKQKFLIEEMEPVSNKKKIEQVLNKKKPDPEPMRVLNKLASVADVQKFDPHICQICKYSSSLSAVRKHYVQKHKFGFNYVRHRVSCKFCSFSTADSRTMEIKKHVMSNHKEMLMKMIAENKIEPKEKLKPSPVKIIESTSKKRQRLSPIKNEKLKKHLKALATRTRIAENMRKIAIQRASMEKDHFEMDGDTIESQDKSAFNKELDVEFENETFIKNEVQVKSYRKQSGGGNNEEKSRRIIKEELQTEEQQNQEFKEEEISKTAVKRTVKRTLRNIVRNTNKETDEKNVVHGRPRKYSKGEEPYNNPGMYYNIKLRTWRPKAEKLMKSESISPSSNNTEMSNQDMLPVKDKDEKFARSRSSSISSKSSVSEISSIVQTIRTRRSKELQSPANANIGNVASGNLDYNTDKLMLTRSGKMIKKPETDSSYVTESSLEEDEDTAEDSEEDISEDNAPERVSTRRMSPRNRRLSERSKTSFREMCEFSDDSDEDIKPILTRSARSKLTESIKVTSEMERDSNVLKKNEDNEAFEENDLSKRADGETNVKQVKIGNVKTREKIDERVLTRQVSKAVSDKNTKTRQRSFLRKSSITSMKSETTDESSDPETVTPNTDHAMRTRRSLYKKNKDSPLEIRNVNAEKDIKSNQESTFEPEKNENEGDVKVDDVKLNTLEGKADIRKVIAKHDDLKFNKYDKRQSLGNAIQRQVVISKKDSVNDGKINSKSVESDEESTSDTSQIETPYKLRKRQKSRTIYTESDIDDHHFDKGKNKEEDSDSAGVESDESEVMPTKRITRQNSRKMQENIETNEIETVMEKKENMSKISQIKTTVLIGPEDDEFAGLQHSPTKAKNQSETECESDYSVGKELNEAINDVEKVTTPDVVADNNTAKPQIATTTVLEHDDEFEFLQNSPAIDHLPDVKHDAILNSSTLTRSFEKNKGPNFDSEFLKFAEKRKENKETSESSSEESDTELPLKHSKPEMIKQAKVNTDTFETDDGDVPILPPKQNFASAFQNFAQSSAEPQPAKHHEAKEIEPSVKTNTNVTSANSQSIGFINVFEEYFAKKERRKQGSVDSNTEDSLLADESLFAAEKDGEDTSDYDAIESLEAKKAADIKECFSQIGSNDKGDIDMVSESNIGVSKLPKAYYKEKYNLSDCSVKITRLEENQWPVKSVQENVPNIPSEENNKLNISKDKQSTVDDQQKIHKNSITESEVIVIDDSDGENVEKNKRECSTLNIQSESKGIKQSPKTDLKEIKADNKSVEDKRLVNKAGLKSAKSPRHTKKLNDQENETLIQEIVITDSLINSLVAEDMELITQVTEMVEPITKSVNNIVDKQSLSKSCASAFVDEDKCKQQNAKDIVDNATDKVVDKINNEKKMNESMEPVATVNENITALLMEKASSVTVMGNAPNKKIDKEDVEVTEVNKNKEGFDKVIDEINTPEKEHLKSDGSVAIVQNIDIKEKSSADESDVVILENKMVTTTNQKANNENLMVIESEGTLSTTVIPSNSETNKKTICDDFSLKLMDGNKPQSESNNTFVTIPLSIDKCTNKQSPPDNDCSMDQTNQNIVVKQCVMIENNSVNTVKKSKLDSEVTHYEHSHVTEHVPVVEILSEKEDEILSCDSQLSAKKLDKKKEQIDGLNDKTHQTLEEKSLVQEFSGDFEKVNRTEHISVAVQSEPIDKSNTNAAENDIECLSKPNKCTEMSSQDDLVEAVCEPMSDVDGHDGQEIIQTSEKHEVCEQMLVVDGSDGEEIVQASEKSAVLKPISDVKGNDGDEIVKTSEKPAVSESMSDVEGNDGDEIFQRSEKPAPSGPMSDDDGNDGDKIVQTSEKHEVCEQMSDVDGNVSEKRVQPSAVSEPMSGVKGNDVDEIVKTSETPVVSEPMSDVDAIDGEEIVQTSEKSAVSERMSDVDGNDSDKIVQTSEKHEVSEPISDVKGNDGDEIVKTSEKPAVSELMSDFKGNDGDEIVQRSEKSAPSESMSDVDAINGDEKPTVSEPMSDVKGNDGEELVQTNETPTVCEPMSDVDRNDDEGIVQTNETPTVCEPMSDVDRNDVEETVQTSEKREEENHDFASDKSLDIITHKIDYDIEQKGNDNTIKETNIEEKSTDVIELTSTDSLLDTGIYKKSCSNEETSSERKLTEVESITNKASGSSAFKYSSGECILQSEIECDAERDSCKNVKIDVDKVDSEFDDSDIEPLAKIEDTSENNISSEIEDLASENDQIPVSVEQTSGYLVSVKNTSGDEHYQNSFEDDKKQIFPSVNHNANKKDSPTKDTPIDKNNPLAHNTLSIKDHTSESKLALQVIITPVKTSGKEMMSQAMTTVIDHQAEEQILIAKTESEVDFIPNGNESSNDYTTGTEQKSIDIASVPANGSVHSVSMNLSNEKFDISGGIGKKEDIDKQVGGKFTVKVSNLLSHTSEDDVDNRDDSSKLKIIDTTIQDEGEVTDDHPETHHVYPDDGEMGTILDKSNMLKTVDIKEQDKREVSVDHCNSIIPLESCASKGETLYTEQSIEVESSLIDRCKSTLDQSSNRPVIEDNLIENITTNEMAINHEVSVKKEVVKSESLLALQAYSKDDSDNDIELLENKVVSTGNVLEETIQTNETTENILSCSEKDTNVDENDEIGEKSNITEDESKYKVVNEKEHIEITTENMVGQSSVIATLNSDNQIWSTENNQKGSIEQTVGITTETKPETVDDTKMPVNQPTKMTDETDKFESLETYDTDILILETNIEVQNSTVSSEAHEYESDRSSDIEEITIQKPEDETKLGTKCEITRKLFEKESVEDDTVSAEAEVLDIEENTELTAKENGIEVFEMDESLESNANKHQKKDVAIEIANDTIDELVKQNEVDVKNNIKSEESNIINEMETSSAYTVVDEIVSKSRDYFEKHADVEKEATDALLASNVDKNVLGNIIDTVSIDIIPTPSVHKLTEKETGDDISGPVKTLESQESEPGITELFIKSAESDSNTTTPDYLLANTVVEKTIVNDNRDEFDEQNNVTELPNDNKESVLDENKTILEDKLVQSANKTLTMTDVNEKQTVEQNEESFDSLTLEKSSITDDNQSPIEDMVSTGNISNQLMDARQLCERIDNGHESDSSVISLISLDDAQDNPETFLNDFDQGSSNRPPVNIPAEKTSSQVKFSVNPDIIVQNMNMNVPTTDVSKEMVNEVVTSSNETTTNTAEEIKEDENMKTYIAEHDKSHVCIELKMVDKLPENKRLKESLDFSLISPIDTAADDAVQCSQATEEGLVSALGVLESVLPVSQNKIVDIEISPSNTDISAKSNTTVSLKSSIVTAKHAKEFELQDVSTEPSGSEDHGIEHMETEFGVSESVCEGGSGTTSEKEKNQSITSCKDTNPTYQKESLNLEEKVLNSGEIVKISKKRDESMTKRRSRQLSGKSDASDEHHLTSPRTRSRETLKDDKNVLGRSQVDTRYMKKEDINMIKIESLVEQDPKLLNSSAKGLELDNTEATCEQPQSEFDNSENVGETSSNKRSSRSRGKPKRDCKKSVHEGKDNLTMESLAADKKEEKKLVEKGDTKPSSDVNEVMSIRLNLKSTSDIETKESAVVGIKTKQEISTSCELNSMNTHSNSVQMKSGKDSVSLLSPKPRNNSKDGVVRNRNKSKDNTVEKQHEEKDNRLTAKEVQKLDVDAEINPVDGKSRYSLREGSDAKKDKQIEGRRRSGGRYIKESNIELTASDSAVDSTVESVDTNLGKHKPKGRSRVSAKELSGLEPLYDSSGVQIVTRSNESIEGVRSRHSSRESIDKNKEKQLTPKSRTCVKTTPIHDSPANAKAFAQKGASPAIKGDNTFIKTVTKCKTLSKDDNRSTDKETENKILSSGSKSGESVKGENTDAKVTSRSRNSSKDSIERNTRLRHASSDNGETHADTRIENKNYKNTGKVSVKERSEFKPDKNKHPIEKQSRSSYLHNENLKLETRSNLDHEESVESITKTRSKDENKNKIELKNETKQNVKQGKPRLPCTSSAIKTPEIKKKDNEPEKGVNSVDLRKQEVEKTVSNTLNNKSNTKHLVADGTAAKSKGVSKVNEKKLDNAVNDSNVKTKISTGTQSEKMSKSKIMVTKKEAEKVSPKLQEVNETDEDFKRRTEAVKSARKKSGVKSYECDFNFDDSKAGTQDSAPQHPSHPLENEYNLDSNADVASLYSSTSSGGSSNSNNGKELLRARCLSDFISEKTTVVKPVYSTRKVQPVARSSALTSPQKTTISEMAVKLAKGVSTLKSESRAHTLTPQALVSDKVKKYNKHPSVDRRTPMTRPVSNRLRSPDKSLNIRGNLSPQQLGVISAKKIKLSGSPSSRLPCKSESMKTLSAGVKFVNREVKSKESLSKVKSLRELHKGDKPFRWEDSPGRETRSKVKFSSEHESEKETIESINGKSKSKTRNIPNENGNLNIESGSKTDVCEKSRRSDVKRNVSEVFNAEFEKTNTSPIKDKERSGSVTKRTRVEVKKVVEDDNTSETHLSAEPPGKKCKLDGTANSPSNSPSNSPQKKDRSDLANAECQHNRVKTDCDICRANRSPSPQRYVFETRRSSVRQIIHGGKVFEIQKGSVTERDIQKTPIIPFSMASEQSSPPSQVRLRARTPTATVSPPPKSRSVVRKRAHSPEEVVNACMKDDKPVKGVGNTNINDFICATLNEIRKQRQDSSETSSKWTIKKDSRSKYPYTYKKSKRIN